MNIKLYEKSVGGGYTFNHLISISDMDAVSITERVNIRLMLNHILSLQKEGKLPTIVSNNGNKLAWRRISPFRFEIFSKTSTKGRVYLDIILSDDELADWVSGHMGNRPYLIVNWSHPAAVLPQFKVGTTFGDFIIGQVGRHESDHFAIICRISKLTNKRTLVIISHSMNLAHIVGKGGHRVKNMLNVLNSLPNVKLEHIQLRTIEEVSKHRVTVTN